jgi:hypothetical protein
MAILVIDPVSKINPSSAYGCPVQNDANQIEPLLTSTKAARAKQAFTLRSMEKGVLRYYGYYGDSALIHGMIDPAPAREQPRRWSP